MKKNVTKILLFSIICALAFSSCSYSKTQNGIEFLGGNPAFQGVRDITFWAGKHVVIPAEYNGLPVRSLRDDDWLKLPSIYETLILPETIEIIGRDFYENASKKLKYNEYGNGLYLGTENNPYFAFIKPKNIETADEMSYRIDSGVNDVPKETPATPPYDMNGSDISECVIHPDTKVIADNAFEGCQKLKSITVPGGIKVISDYCFAGCTSLESLVLEEGVEQINYSAIEGCYSLKEVYLPDTLNTNTYMSFYECKSLESVRLPSTLIAIPERMFYGCSALQSIEIPDSVTYIGESAFGECSSLKEIYIPANVAGIADWGVFYGCHSLERFTVAENNPNFTVINGELRSKDGTVLVAYPAGKQGEVYTVPEEIVEIRMTAFCGNQNLKSAILHDCVKVAENSKLFMGCTSLESVILGCGIEEINHMFTGCASLKYLFVPASVTNIEIMSFDDCIALENIEVDKNNKKYSSVNGVLYDAVQDELLRYPAGKSDVKYSIPNGTRYIGMHAFYKAKNLKEVVFPSTLLKIGNSAFGFCDGLTDINIPKNVKTLGASAFAYCSSLKNVVIGDGITILPDGLLYGCTSLESVKLGKNVKVINSRAIHHTLKSITFPRGLEKVEYDGVGLITEYHYEGTKAEWMKIHKNSKYFYDNYSRNGYTVYCSDGKYHFFDKR